MQKKIAILYELIKKDRFLLLFFIILSFIVFSPSFINLNYFWDDERFVFLNPSLIQSPSFLNFWNPNSIFFKTWPLGYSVFWWLLNYSPFTSIAFYKSLNILVHALNGYLVVKLLKKLELKYVIIPSLFFLIHPMQVESVSWIFQLLTLLSFSLFISSLLLFIEHCKKSNLLQYILSTALFAFSLWTKSVAILAPFIFFIFCWYYKKSIKFYFFILPFFVISFFTGVVNIKGVESFAQTNQNTSWKTALFNAINSNIKSISPEDRNKIVNDNANMYFQSIYGNIEKKKTFAFDGFNVFQQGVLHYASKFIFPINLNFIYPQKNTNLALTFSLLMTIIGIPIVLGIKLHRLWFIVSPVFIIFLAPYMGITYITFFYWSPVSDRYVYFAMTGVVLIISLILNSSRVKYHRYAVAVLIIFSFCSILYGTKFNRPEKLYEEIVEYKPHPVIYSVLFERYFLNLDRINAERVLNEGLKKFPANPNLQIDLMRLESLKKSLKTIE